VACPVLPRWFPPSEATRHAVVVSAQEFHRGYKTSLDLTSVISGRLPTLYQTFDDFWVPLSGA